ncbi:CLUMA_CG010269, isoform A [Clunio marinus]|uniref:CLUMA_CG010269, isoform A n=1 Tax=Clunio marinus TaxID=568069 RepID=A0A1J1IAN7_9DIPT|nr:CLUMA_CG010269, isoform A [Clunio marinus]
MLRVEAKCPTFCCYSFIFRIAKQHRKKHKQDLHLSFTQQTQQFVKKCETIALAKKSSSNIAD